MRVLISVILIFFNSVSLANPFESLITLTKEIDTMQADFIQETYSSTGELLSSKSGSFKLDKPNKFNWQIVSPEQVTVISDGKKVYNYDHALEQITIQNADNIFKLSPISFIFSENNQQLKDSFKVVRIDQDKQCSLKHSGCFKLISIGQDAGLQHLELKIIDKKLTLLVIYDNLGQISKISFNKVRNNIKLSQDNFIFKPPPNVDIIYLD